MVDDQIKVTHDNNGRFYRIKMDLAKEGSEIWDLTPYFKGRVGDNRFGLQVVWTYQGRLLDTTGMKPYIEGNVGNYSFDDKKDLQLAPDAATVRYTGSPSDCQSGGRVTYYFPEQMFPRDGIFKGYIGLLDDRDDSSQPHISGVTVWFRVLPGIAQMGHACDVYISDLDKALQNFKVKLDQHDKDYQTQLQRVIDDARNTYESETKNAHDSLDALKSQIQANRDEQQNLSQRLAGTEQQIQIHDVVTRPEFLSISNQLTQQVSQMKEAGLEFFSNVDDLKAKYPQGANKLCVTLNDSHEWVYDYANGKWNDAGAFNYGTIDPKLTSAIFQPNPDNLIKNSQFITTNSWNLGRDKTDPDCYVESTSQGNAMVINGYVADGSTNESWIVTDPIEVSDSKYISVGADIALSGIDYSNGKSAMIGFTFTDKKGKITVSNRYIPAYYQDGKYHKISELQIAYPPEVQTVAIAFAFYGYGTMKVRRPQASFSYVLKPYSADDLNKSIRLTDDNLLIGQPLIHWDFNNFNQTATVDADDAVVLDTSNAQGSDANYIDSDFINVAEIKDLDINFIGKTSPSSKCFVEIHQYRSNDDSTELENFISEPVTNTSDWHNYKFSNINLDSVTKFIKARLSVVGKGVLSAKKLSIKEADNGLINQYLRQKNLAYNFLNWTVLSNPENMNAKYSNNSVNLDSSDPSYNGIKSELIAIDSTKPLNIDFLGKSDGASAWVEIRQYDADKKSMEDFAKISFIKIYVAKSDSLQSYTINGIKLDTNTRYIDIRLVLFGKETLQVANFQANQQDLPEPHNPYENIPLQEWESNSQYATFDSKLWNISTRNLTNTYTWIKSVRFPVKAGSTIQTTIDAKVGLLSGNQGSCYFEIQQFTNYWDEDTNGDKYIDNYLYSTDNKFENFRFINKLNDDTHYIQIVMVVKDNADLQLRSIEGEYVEKLTPDPTNALPQLKIDALSNITSDWQTAHFSFVDKDRVVEGYLQYAMQGNSSRNYPKKNLKVKFFEDKDCKSKLKWRPKADWNENSKFNIKANYVDATQARNLVNASLVRDAMEVTPFANNQVANKLLKTQNLGQMEGFPIELSFDDGYYGLMTFNTKKDDKPFGMDSDNKAHEAITNESESSSENLNNPQDQIDGKHFSTVLQKNVNPDVQANFTKFLTFINTANDADFKAHIGDYIDLYSVINLYLFGVWSYEWDYYNKSEILLTYDSGKSYYMLAYDLDSTWRMWWDGSKLLENDVADFATANKSWIEGNGNKLLNRIYQLFKPEIKAQWQKLRASVWTNSRAVNAFKKFIRSVPEDAYERDQTKWTDIPSKSITNFAQIQQAIIERGNAMDNFMEHFADSQPTSPTPQPTTPQAQPNQSNN